MPKMRGFKPQLWSWSKFVRVSPPARLMFMGMWNYACDNGHITDDTFELKLQILPNDVVDPDELVEEMLAVGLIERHDEYFTIPKLSKHQGIDTRYLVLCDHCEHDEGAKYTPDDRTGYTRGARRARDERTPGTRRADDERTTSARVEGEVEVEVEGEGEGEKKNTPCARASERPAGLSRFDEFYELYPKKAARGAAEKAWPRALRHASADEIIDGLRGRLGWFATQVRHDGDYRPAAGPWLNQKRWLDEDDPTPTPARTLTRGQQAFADNMSALEALASESAPEGVAW